MPKTAFDAYIGRFNREDGAAFDDFLLPDVEIRNGALLVQGLDAMKAHYQDHIWPYFQETLHPIRYIGNDHNVVVEMWTNFRAKVMAETLFGPVVPGEQYDHRGLIMYDLRDGKLATITVACNSFSKTSLNGACVEFGTIH